MSPSPLRIGLTGGIGSGKSTVARHWEALGATLIDTDAISRQLTAAGGAAMPAIAAAFGPETVDANGAMDRAHMRQLAFSDVRVRQQLEALLHPLIALETSRLAAASAAPVQVFDVPLLVESGRWRQQVDRVLVVDCRVDTQVQRVMARSGWAEAAVRSVIAQQATRAQRLACADAVICNDAVSIESLAAEVLMLWQRWCPSGH